MLRFKGQSLLHNRVYKTTTALTGSRSYFLSPRDSTALAVQQAPTPLPSAGQRCNQRLDKCEAVTDELPRQKGWEGAGKLCQRSTLAVRRSM